MSSTGRYANHKNVKQMLNRMLMGMPVRGMSLSSIIRLNQARKRPSAPICHCQDGAHQHLFPNPDTKMNEKTKVKT